MDQGSVSLPFSQACENNKAPILARLTPLVESCARLLEVGSGTGQHATWFAQHLPWLEWQPTEIESNLAMTRQRCEHFSGGNLLPVQSLDVTDKPWGVEVPQVVYTANTLHIMPLTSVMCFFESLGRLAAPGTVLVVYGPFNYGGHYTSQSNERFDQWLSQQHPLSGIRHFEQVDSLAGEAGFVLQSDCEMPANNRLLVWRKR